MALIRCGDDGFAPATIVCKHLVDGRSMSWCPVGSGDPEVDHDWLCPRCLKEYPRVAMDKLMTVCLHCARRLRRRATRMRRR